MHMKVGNTEIDFHIDYVNKKFHLVDLENTGMHKLTNNFKILSPKVPYLYKPYLDYMQKTKKGNL
jgi:hypothetical protein